MSNFINAIKRHAASMDYQFSHGNMGTVISYNQLDNTAKVMLHPQEETTGWIPVLYPSVGPASGLVTPPVQGQQVFVHFEGGDINSGVLMGGIYSDMSLPAVGFNGAAVESGEFAAVFGQMGGTIFHITNNGDMNLVSTSKVFVQVGNTTLTVTPSGVSIVGNVTVQGSITSTQDMVAGTVSVQNHVNTGVQAGSDNSGPPAA